MYRFPNGMVNRNGHLCWNLDELWTDILEGMKKCKALGKIPLSVGVDTWGVDYVLLDAEDRMVGDSIAYRDSRTSAVMDNLSDQWLYKHTGIMRQPFNTVYQLMATPARMLCAALTDAVGDHRTQNQPGTTDEYPNWRVPLSGPDGKPMTLEDVFHSERALRMSAVMNGFVVPPTAHRSTSEFIIGHD